MGILYIIYYTLLVIGIILALISIFASDSKIIKFRRFKKTNFTYNRRLFVLNRLFLLWDATIVILAAVIALFTERGLSVQLLFCLSISIIAELIFNKKNSR